MNKAYATSPDYTFRNIAVMRRHPCAHEVKDSNGLITITFVHVFSRSEDRHCSRCDGIMPLTFWQFTDKMPTEQTPS